jgi:hypothetical protein
MRKIYVAIIVIITVCITFFYWNNQQKIAAISNFDECAAAGYEIMESYPARCMTPDKRSFTQIISDEEKQKLIPPSNDTQSGFTCGNGVCENITCDAIGCPDAESPASCPRDCPYDR